MAVSIGTAPSTELDVLQSIFFGISASANRDDDVFTDDVQWSLQQEYISAGKCSISHLLWREMKPPALCVCLLAVSRSSPD